MGEKWIHECIGMFIKSIEKMGPKRDWKNSAWFVDREGNVGKWWENSNEPNTKGCVANTEIETIRRKIENEGRDEVNEGTMQESDNIEDINDDNVVINHVDSANEEPITIIENDLSDFERDKLLRLREALESDGFGKTEVNLNYGDKEKIKEAVSKMNKVLEHVFQSRQMKIGTWWTAITGRQ